MGNMKTRFNLLRSRGWNVGEKLDGGYFAEFNGEYFEGDNVERLYNECRRYHCIVLLRRVRDNDNVCFELFERKMLAAIVGKPFEIYDNEIVTLKINADGKFYL